MSLRKVKVYSEYDLPPHEGLDCSVEPSMTQQSFKDECDINNIMDKYQQTGFIDEFYDRQNPQFADVSTTVDFHTAQNLLSAATEAYNALDPVVRSRFGSPLDFLSFVDNPHNAQALIDMGLAVARLPLQEDVKDPPRGSSNSPIAEGPL
jgi:hypothetical protein